MLFCTNCGNKIEPGANFCNACGTRVEPLQPEPVAKEESAKKTGNYTKEGRKIIDGGPKPAKQSSAKTGSSVKSPPRKAYPKKKEKTLLGCFFQTVLVLVSIVIVSAFLIYVVNILLVEDDGLTDTNIPGIVDIEPADKSVQKTGSGKQSPQNSKVSLKTKKILTEQTVSTDTSNVVITVSDDITIILPAGLFDGDEQLVVAELEPITLPFDGRKCPKVIDITLGKFHELEDYVEIQVIPPAGFDPNRNFAQCFTQNNNNWEQVLSFYDSDLKKIRSFTNHFTMFSYTYETFRLVHDPMMKVAAESANLWGRLTDGAEAKLLDGYDPSKIMQQQSDDYLAASWNSSLELYGLESAGLSFAENILDMAELGDLNNMVGNIGFGLALVNSAMDAQRGKKEKAVLESLKNTYNFMASKVINTKALNVAFIGVFAIDYALTTFANEAWEGRRNLYRKVFDNFNYHQRTKEKKNLRWWKKEIYWRMEDGKDPSKFESVVENLIQEYIQEFWDKDVERAIIQAELQKHGWTYNGGYSDKLKEDLNPEFRIYILQYIQPLIERMQLNYLLSAKELQKQKIQEFGQVLNQEHHIRCMVELEDDENPKDYKGFKVAFKVAPNISKMWEGFLSEDAMFDLFCTRAGFISAGNPNEANLLIPLPDEVDKFEKLKAKVKLQPANEVTYVKFLTIVDFPYGKWKVMIRPQGSVDGDTQMAGSRSEAGNIVKKQMSSYLQNPSFAKSTDNYANLGDNGITEFLKKGNFTYKMKGNLFILTNLGQEYELNFVIKLTDDKHFIGKMFAYSKSGNGYWVNIQDVKATKIN